MLSYDACDTSNAIIARRHQLLSFVLTAICSRGSWQERIEIVTNLNKNSRFKARKEQFMDFAKHFAVPWMRIAHAMQ